MIAFHKRNFPLHHCMGARRNFRRERGGGQAQKAPPPHALREKVAETGKKIPT